MKKGNALPAILIFAVFASVPVMTWALLLKNSTNSPAVKGSETNSLPVGSYINVEISSPSEVWELNEYLCKTSDECATSLDSGDKWGNLSGGPDALHEVVVVQDDKWEEYNYLKIYVRPGLSSQGTAYEPALFGEISIQSVAFEDTRALIIPVSDIKSGKISTLTFSN
ncbi:MAG TPA: hypothetical protein VJB17_03500 [Patescibacteria group bacterium]|nr:hypothetical protein [Patescibacteria group bacterium]